MKFYNKILAVAAAASITLGGLTSCDYLDVLPENTLPEESVDYTNIEDMYQPVSGMYATLRNNGMHWVINMMTVIRDGDVWSGRTDDQGDLVNFEKYVYGSYWGIKEMWNQYYGMIKTANATLQSLDAYAENITNDADMKKYKSYCGEVRILRAWAYYRLAQAFGDVTILESNDQDADLRRSTRNAVLRYALADCKYAKENCFELHPAAMEHEGAYSAYSGAALGAKCALLLEDWATVEEYTNYIINSGKFKLYDDFYQLFKIPGKLSSECLMECQSTFFGMATGESILPGAFFSSVGTTVTNQDAGDGRAIGGWNFVGYYQSFQDWAYNRGETVRATTSFLKGGTITPSNDLVNMPSSTTNTDCWNGKWYVPVNQIPNGRWDYGGDNNVRMLRYAEVLLMNAEALVRQNKGGADTPFNLVRTRAKMPSITGVTLNDILDERRMELCCEWGTRYEDLVRCGLAQQVLGPKGWTPEKAYFPVPSEHASDYPILREDPIE